MNLLDNYRGQISYKDIIQLDGAISACHINYGKSPLFYMTDAKSISITSRKNSLSSKNSIDTLNNISSFFDVERGLKKEDKIILWKNFWLEYINSYNKMTNILPRSIVTVYLGRHAIELGIKYILLKKLNKIEKGHDLGILIKKLFNEFQIKEDYMKYVDSFCILFCNNIEGGNSEFFRYPEYKENYYFAGNRLDIEWLNYNISLVLLKLVHFSGLDNEI